MDWPRLLSSRFQNIHGVWFRNVFVGLRSLRVPVRRWYWRGWLAIPTGACEPHRQGCASHGRRADTGCIARPQTALSAPPFVHQRQILVTSPAIEVLILETDA